MTPVFCQIGKQYSLVCPRILMFSLCAIRWKRLRITALYCWVWTNIDFPFQWNSYWALFQVFCMHYRNRNESCRAPSRACVWRGGRRACLPKRTWGRLLSPCCSRRASRRKLYVCLFNVYLTEGGWGGGDGAVSACSPGLGTYRQYVWRLDITWLFLIL